MRSNEAVRVPVGLRLNLALLFANDGRRSMASFSPVASRQMSHVVDYRSPPVSRGKSNSCLNSVTIQWFKEVALTDSFHLSGVDDDN